MNESDVDYLIEQLNIKHPEFIDVPLNDEGIYRQKKAALLLDSVIDMLIEICGNDMPACLDMRKDLKNLYYHAKLSLAQNQHYRLNKCDSQ